MRLIDADTLAESMAIENAVKWGNKDGYQQDHSYSTLMRYEIKDEIDAQPTIPAVPLDKLCEWLAKNACYDQLEDYGMRSRFSLLAEQWKFALTKWMEGLDAAD